MRDTYKELWYVYNTLQELHARHPDTSFNLDELKTAFYTKYPEAKQETYGGLFNALQEVRLSPLVGEGILADIKRRKSLLKLSEQAYKVASGVAEQETLNDWIKEINEERTDTVHNTVSTDLDTLLANTYSDTGLRWRLDCLNKSLGSLRDGDFGFLFARPETGKTTFLASELSFMLDQATRPVIWLNNEEQGEKVMIRVYQAYFGVDLATLMGNKRKYHDAFKKLTDGKFFMYDDATMSKKDVESIINRHNPQLVVYDQLPKIKGFKNDRQDLLLGDICQWAREQSKGRHAAIGVCQADASGEGVRWLHMDNVANAKTAMQAEADWIAGIGAIHDDNQQFVRFINISKNKLMGDKDSISALKHGKFETLIDPNIARYRDVVNYN